MRVALSCNALGGFGGAQRNVESIIRATEDHHVDVFARLEIRSGYFAKPKRGRIYDQRWWVRSARTDLRGRAYNARAQVSAHRLQRYDLYLQLRQGLYVDGIRAGTKLIIPSGGVLTVTPEQFDYAALQAPDNQSLLPPGLPGILLPPPFYPLAEDTEQVRGVPSEFGLTVFNNYGAIKGLESMISVAKSSSVPIIWVCSTETHADQVPHDLPKGIIVLRDLDPRQIWWLYQRCKFYVNFSQREGFGWAVADALAAGAPVISRETGILSLPGIDRTGISLYCDIDEIDNLINSVTHIRHKRDMSAVSPSSFVENLTAIVADAV